MAPFGAATWSQLPAPPGGADIGQPNDAIYSESRDILILSTAEDLQVTLPALWGALHRSLDRGLTWATVYRGVVEDPVIPTAPFRVGLLRDPLTGAEVFVAIVRKVTYSFSSPTTITLQVYRSVNGLSWTPGQVLVSVTSAVLVSWAVSAFTSRREIGAALAEHFIFARAKDEDTGIETRGCFRSQDAGLTWTNISDPGTFQNTDLVTIPDQSTLVASVVGSPGRVTRSVDGGLSWIPTASLFPGNVTTAPIAAFGGGPLVCLAQGGLISGEATGISCDEGRTWPQLGPAIPETAGAVVAPPVLIRLHPSTWEVLLINGVSAGRFYVVYSNDGGETGTPEVVQGPGAIFFQTRAGVRLADGRPIFFRGGAGTGPGQTWISSDVASGKFGARIFCVTAPAPGVGIAGFPEPCGDFYNPCPQECPADPAGIEGLVVAILPPVVQGGSWPFGDEELTYGDDPAIYGGDPTTILSIPVLGLPAGCGHTFVNELCAPAGCPA